MLTSFGDRLTVICVTKCHTTTQNFIAIVDYDVQLKAKKLTHRGMSTLCTLFKHTVLIDEAIVTHSKRSRIHKGQARNNVVDTHRERLQYVA